MADKLTTDAQNRAFRTFLQGIAVDVLAAVSLAAYTLLTSTDAFSWALLGALVAKSAAIAVASFVMRRFVDASGIPTPLPPADIPVENPPLVPWGTS